MKDTALNMTDCHTHRLLIPEGEIAVRSLCLSETDKIGGGAVSVGLHPWKTGMVDFNTLAGKFETFLKSNNVVAVGEIGLDKLRGAALPEQMAIFRLQAELAAQYEKPLILHIVRAFPDVIRMHREMAPEMPWIVHGFNHKLDLAKELLQEGFMLSFGADLLRPAGPAAAALALCPEGRFLMETDTWPGDFRLIYDAAAGIRVRLHAPFVEEITQTFNHVFRIC